MQSLHPLSQDCFSSRSQRSPFTKLNLLQTQAHRRLSRHDKLLPCQAASSIQQCSSNMQRNALRENRSHAVGQRLSKALALRLQKQSKSLHSFRLLAIPNAVGPSDEEEEFEGDFGKLSEAVESLAKSLDDTLQGTNIYLVGMMGSGKSTVGRMLAKALQYQFFDTDNLIELAARRSVSDIFTESGEETFRDAETDTLKALAPVTAAVVATGGGAVLRMENWGAMHHSIVVFLSGSAPLLAARVVAEGAESRPLISSLADSAKDEQEELRKTTEKLSAILEARQVHYDMADVEVTLSGGSGDKGLGAPAMIIAYRVLKGVQAKIKAATYDREMQKNFKIEMNGKTVSS